MDSRDIKQHIGPPYYPKRDNMAAEHSKDAYEHMSWYLLMGVRFTKETVWE